jgi:hypothetical protein
MDSSRYDNTYHEEEEEHGWPGEEVPPFIPGYNPSIAEEETYTPPAEEETYFPPAEEELPPDIPSQAPKPTPKPTTTPKPFPTPVPEEESAVPPFVPGFNPPPLKPKKKSHVVDPKVQDLYCAPITNAFACDLSGSCSWVNSQNRCYSQSTADLLNSMGGGQSSGDDDSFSPAQLPAININSPLNFVFDDTITVESTADPIDNDDDDSNCYYDEEQDSMVCPPTTNIMVLDPIVSSILKEKIVVEEKAPATEQPSPNQDRSNCQRPCFHDGASCDMNRYIASGAPSKDNKWWAADKQAENQNRVCGNTFDGHLYANLEDHNLYSSVLSPVSGNTIPFAEVNPSEVSSPDSPIDHEESQNNQHRHHRHHNGHNDHKDHRHHKDHNGQREQEEPHQELYKKTNEELDGQHTSHGGAPVIDHSNIPYCRASKNQQHGVSLPNPLKSELYCESPSQIHTNSGSEHCRGEGNYKDCCPPNSHPCRPRYDGSQHPIVEGFAMTDHTIDFSTKWLVGCLVLFTLYFTIKIYLKKK